MSDQGIEIQVVDSAGKSVGSRALSADVFGVKASKHVLNQVVRWQRAKARAGTHSVLTRAEMTGGGKKPWKQKGTGNARAGSNTSPIWVGGGIAHGPKQRSYEFSVNKKERKLALSGALSARVGEGRFIAVSDLSLTEPKTKLAVQRLRAVGVSDSENALVVLPAGSEQSAKSLRNIPRVRVVEVSGLNVYDVLNAKVVVVVGEALDGIEKRLRKENS